MGEIESKIRDWLDQQGYPLEMRVASAFRRSGFRVFQSDYYSDPATGVPREIDVVAYMDRRLSGLLVRVKFLIECKSSKSKPWLMFCAADQGLAEPARVAQRSASEIGSEALLKLAQRKNIQACGLFNVCVPPAYGLTQAFTSGTDVCYAASTTAAAAAAAAAIEAEKYSKSVSPICVLAFPVIVVEGRLFSCVLQDNGSIAVTESQRGTLLWRNSLAGEPHTIITVLTDSDVPKYASQSASAIKQFLGSCEKEMMAALHKWKARNSTKPRTKVQRKPKLQEKGASHNSNRA